MHRPARVVVSKIGPGPFLPAPIRIFYTFSRTQMCKLVLPDGELIVSLGEQNGSICARAIRMWRNEYLLPPTMESNNCALFAHNRAPVIPAVIRLQHVAFGGIAPQILMATLSFDSLCAMDSSPGSRISNTLFYTSERRRSHNSNQQLPYAPQFQIHVQNQK